MNFCFIRPRCGELVHRVREEALELLDGHPPIVGLVGFLEQLQRYSHINASERLGVRPLSQAFATLDPAQTAGLEVETLQQGVDLLLRDSPDPSP